MRRYDNQETGHLQEVKCNKCGKNMCFNKNIITEGTFSVDYIWGFFSDKDGQKHAFDLCEKCYDEFIKTFIIPADISDENELL